MRKYSSVVLIVIVLLLGTGVAFLMAGGSSLRGKGPVATGSGSPSGAETGETQRRSLIDWLRAPRAAVESAQLPPTALQSPIDQQCLDFFSLVQKLDLNHVQEAVSNAGLPNPEGCTRLPAELAKLQERYQASCGAFVQGRPQAEVSPSPDDVGRVADCTMVLYFLRAGISVWQNSDRKLEEITDLRLLTDHLATAFASMTDGKVPDPAQMIRVAERILEVDPKIYGAAKAVLIGEMLQGVGGEKKREDEAFWRNFEKRLDRAREMNASDPELDEMTRMAKTNGYDPERVRADSLQRIAAQPESVDAHYFLAYAEWKLGNRRGAFGALQRAMQLAPDREDLQVTWRAIRQPGANSEAFKMNVRFGLSFDDILK